MEYGCDFVYEVERWFWEEDNNDECVSKRKVGVFLSWFLIWVLLIFVFYVFWGGMGSSVVI